MMSPLRAITAAVLGLSLFARPDPDVAEGNRLYRDGKYAEALQAYRRAKVDSAGERRRIAFNRGTALLRMGELGEAREALREVQGDPDASLRARAAFNEGNAAFGMKDLAAAVAAFRTALLADPKLEGARRNLELALLAMQRPDAGSPEGGSGDGSSGGDGNQAADGGVRGDGGGASDGGGGGAGDGGRSGKDGGASQQPSQPKPQPTPQQEIEQQDALRLLDSLRDAEQDRLLMRFLEQEATQQKVEKNW